MERELLARAGVTGVDTGPKIVDGIKTATWSIRVYVERKHDVPPEEALPTEIDGVPVDVIQRRFVPHSDAAAPDPAGEE